MKKITENKLTKILTNLIPSYFDVNSTIYY